MSKELRDIREVKDEKLREIIRQDIKTLHGLGYAQQLYREMGGFSNFAISFSIISILTGAIILYGYGLKFGGPVINTIGWPLVSIMVWAVAASMAEIASMYPTAGGLYYWAWRLGGVRWAWWTAWFNMLGQIAITAGINNAAAVYIVGAFSTIFGIPPDTPVPLLGTISSYNFYLLVMALIMIPQVLINVMGIRLTAILNDFSVWWHIGGVAIIALLLTIFGKHHNDLAFLFSGITTVKPIEVATEFPLGPATLPSIMLNIPGLRGLYESASLGAFSIFAFVLGLLQAQWTYTGYDASAHVAEETLMARLNSAWGVFLSVFVSSIVGYIVLLALTWSIPLGADGQPDVAGTASAAYPVLYITDAALKGVLGGVGDFFANLIAVIIGVAMWLCGLSSITSMARMWFAFARDDGMPGSSFIKKVSHQYRTPANSIIVTSVLAWLLAWYSGVFSAMVAMSTTALYLAYIFPTLLNFWNKWHQKGEYTTPEKAPWNLGRWGPLVNIVAILWVAFITVLFSIPPNELAGWTMIIMVVLLVVYWEVSEKRRFTGPRVMTEAELAEIEKEFAI